jgi:hypothetical protein
MTTEACKHGKSAPRDLIEALPESQAGAGRHKCAECAYEAGRRDGFNEARQAAEAKK